jgi:4-amino-4-deoxy-L-arabinose transferase-like glycosyltransferase
VLQSIISIFYILGFKNLIFPIIPFLILIFFLASFYLFSKDYKALILMFCFPIFLMYIGKLMTAILATAFVLLSLFFMKEYFIKKKDLFFYLSYLASSLAFLTRYPLGINLLAITLIYFLFEKKKTYFKPFLGLIIFCLPIIPWFNYIGIDSALSALNYVSSESGFFYYFQNILIVLGLSVLFLIFIKNYKYEKKDLFFLIPLILIFAVFQYIHHKEPRYLIPILPFAATFFSKIMKNNKYFFALSIIFFILALNFSIIFYKNLCNNLDNFNEISNFFQSKDKALILSNFWPQVSYYSNNPVLAISEPCNINKRVIDSNASFIVVSSFNPCFNSDYSDYELIKVISNNSCEIINIYKI